MKVIMFCCCSNCFREVLIQLYGHFGGCSLTGVSIILSTDLYPWGKAKYHKQHLQNDHILEYNLIFLFSQLGKYNQMVWNVAPIITSCPKHCSHDALTLKVVSVYSSPCYFLFFKAKISWVCIYYQRLLNMAIQSIIVSTQNLHYLHLG